jgi:hypothetical protein
MKNIIYKVKSTFYKYTNEAKKSKRVTFNELVKYSDFEKDNNNKLLLSFGAGRSGQNWFSKIFNSHLNWVGSSERYSDYESFYRYTTYYGLPIDKNNFFKLLILSAKRDMATHGNSFIASPYLSFGVNEITNNLKPDAIFFNIRNSIKTIESLHKKGWYLDIEKYLEIKSPMIDITTNQYRSFSRILPKNDYLNEWKNLSRIGKITWYWCIINKSILEDFNKINHTKKYYVKLEDINQNYELYEHLSNSFNFRKKLKKKNFLNIINKAPNKGSEDKYFYKYWNEKEKKEYNKITEKFFPYYDSIKTNI